jgi:hypothetical protein
MFVVSGSCFTREVFSAFTKDLFLLLALPTKARI